MKPQEVVEEVAVEQVLQQGCQQRLQTCLDSPQLQLGLRIALITRHLTVLALESGNLNAANGTFLQRVTESAWGPPRAEILTIPDDDGVGRNLIAHCCTWFVVRR
jgi:hypothetical protein